MPVKNKAWYKAEIKRVKALQKAAFKNEDAAERAYHKASTARGRIDDALYKLTNALDALEEADG